MFDALATIDAALASAANSRATVHVTRLRQVRDEIARLQGKLAEIKEQGTAYMQAVENMLAAAERDGLLKPGSAWEHTKATSDAVKHVFGTIN